MAASRTADHGQGFVDCVVVAGKTPEGKAEQKCLELFRRSMKDVQIYAFDELLQKLVQLRDLLASDEPAER
ncbi:hypothetical protein GCM10007857_44150 [Bradyrhizobium iriomotense]|uniref:Anti-sigma factor NepR domain-containing protein n=1 Tax=Bradyrhizobium iriomotense TaxID=441950 RepID=A0ABQ6AZU0_9BRAD|nr:hypothetical protein GCM10007857_44150 [Bradyrhizobium iriomotense]